MPSTTDLWNHNIHVEKGQEPDEAAQPQNGTQPLVDVWRIVFTDQMLGNQVRISFRREARDEIVRMLTGGIVLAGGQLPTI